jgi:acyl-CoA reductase-like NAD-dependent aldehyde dehydrogenase
MLIPHKLRDEVIDIVKGSVERYTVGNPNDEGTKCGPMISKSQYDKVREYIQSGIDEGATLIVGGLEHPEGLEDGFFVKPTVFADVTNDMTIAKEEIFGPVLCIIGYENIDEAIDIANDSEYGLSGGIWSEDVEKAKTIAKRIKTGQISINGGFFNIYAPFGGYKKSGNGRELGKYGLEEFLEIKSIQF